eukprot:TRINITY_DN43506_c0_g1_i1.p1 TRINITY_DN43506_c0_g1~~TRINITY_DN43506_c0_g1_i1.p1  ORF type:complete len:361 (+),score=47.97 TRINITY_DN43506_c0_g1_i1:56-1084(+)
MVETYRQRPLAVVTGANTGIGFHVAKQLVERSFHVILACRDVGKAEKTVSELQRLFGEGATVELQQIDLSRLASVRAFSDCLGKQHQKLDLLVCNAGINAASAPQELPAQLTEDGVDVVYQTNFVSHFLLTLLLLPQLRAARGRVVSVSSVMHRGASLADVSFTRRRREPYVSLYGLSKLAQIVMGAELYRRLGKDANVAFHAVNPGGVASDIWRNYPGWQRWLFGIVLASPETAASTVVEACTCEEGQAPCQPKYWNGYRGAGHLSVFEYWSPLAARQSLVPSDPSHEAMDVEIAKRIWDESMEVFRAAGISVDLAELERQAPSCSSALVNGYAEKPEESK